MKHKLGHKINGAILLTFFVIVIIFVAVYVPYQNSRVKNTTKNVEDIIKILIEHDQEPLANEIYQGLTEAIKLRLDRMLEVRDILLISVFDKSGKLLVSRGPYPSDIRELSEPEIKGFNLGSEIHYDNWHDQYTIIYTHEIRIIGERIGFIRLYFSMEGVKKELRVSYIILGCMLASILITMLALLNFFLSRMIIKPIALLSDTMDHMQAGTIEQYNYRKSKDEIGDLSEAFNRMSRALSKSYRELDSQRKQLLDSQEKYRLLIDNANDAIVVLQDGIIKFVNPRFAEQSGYSMDELPEMHFLDLIAEGDKGLTMGNDIARADGKTAPKDYIFRIKNRDDKLIWVEAHIVLITWEGRPATLNFMRDITHQKKTEEQLQQAQKMEAIGTLAGGIAHDFNNLLQTIQGYTQLLLMDETKRSLSDHELKEILGAAKRGSELTRQLLTFSRKFETHMRPLDINTEIIRVEKILSRTIPKMIEIRLNLEENLYTINADPGQIEQVLMNLAVNARDAMNEGGKILIETKNVFLDNEYCKTHLIEKPGEYVLMSFSDTGYGMNNDTLEHVFEPFFTTKKVEEGTGLGLAMVYGIIMNHKGAINCYSVPGKGTTFNIYLPAIESFKEAAISEEIETPRGGTETILLVDDDETLREIGSQLLERFGYTVILAASGEDALEIYDNEQERIHLVILDLIMPGMGGIKCLEKIFKLNPQAIVIIASGYYVDGGDGAHLKAGAKGFIKKPYVLESMLQEIRRVIEEG